jgi:hypothetical protein
MPEPIPLINLDAVSRARLPLAEQLMDVFADALVAVSDALDISRYGAGNSRITSMHMRIQAVYDEVNSMMKELAD